MDEKELVSRFDESLLKIAYLQNNVSMAKELFNAVSRMKYKTPNDLEIKLYEYERIEKNMETTFNYIDSELEFLFEEICELLQQIR